MMSQATQIELLLVSKKTSAYSQMDGHLLGKAPQFLSKVNMNSKASLIGSLCLHSSDHLQRLEMEVRQSAYLENLQPAGG